MFSAAGLSTLREMKQEMHEPNKDGCINESTGSIWLEAQEAQQGKFGEPHFPGQAPCHSSYRLRLGVDPASKCIEWSCEKGPAWSQTGCFWLLDCVLLTVCKPAQVTHPLLA